MNTGFLECFEKVYETRSINKAAGLLYLTPQSVSKRLQSLEAELDTILFFRTKNGVMPTPGGELLHERSRKILKDMEELQYAMKHFSERERKLRIGYVTGAFNVLPFDAILKFIDLHPELEVSWNEYTNVDLHQMIRESRIDYGIGVGLKTDWETDVIRFKQIGNASAVLLVYEGHPLYTYRTVGIGELRDEPILSLNKDYYIFYRTNHLCEEYGFIPHYVAMTQDTSALIHLCSQRIGLAILPKYSINGLLPEHVRAIPIREDMGLIIHTAILDENREQKVIRLFDDFLMDYLNL